MPTSEETIKKRKKKEHIIEKLTIIIFAFLIPPLVGSIILYILVIHPLPYGEH
jgi:accessory gene regulator protein AgrB